MTNPIPEYIPKNPMLYSLARVVFGAAIRRDDHEATTTVARSLATMLARELDAGRVEVDASGEVTTDTAKRIKVALINGVIHAVDRDGRPVMVPAPRGSETPSMALTLHTGAARLAVALDGPELTEEEKALVVAAAGTMIAVRPASPDSCRGCLSRAIDDVRHVLREDREIEDYIESEASAKAVAQP